MINQRNFSDFSWRLLDVGLCSTANPVGGWLQFWVISLLKKVSSKFRNILWLIDIISKTTSCRTSWIFSVPSWCSIVFYSRLHADKGFFIRFLCTCVWIIFCTTSSKYLFQRHIILNIKVSDMWMHKKRWWSTWGSYQFRVNVCSLNLQAKKPSSCLEPYLPRLQRSSLTLVPRLACRYADDP